MMAKFVEYQKLEKVEVGGLIGRWYGPVVETVYHRFSKYMEKMISISYDPLDLLNEANNVSFLEDYEFYSDMSDDIDNRLATVSEACFESSDDLMSLHKVSITRLIDFMFFALMRAREIRYV